MQTANFKSLHTIRGLCALLVVIYHAKFVLWSGGSLYKETIGFHSYFDYFLFGIDLLSSCGKQAVLLFFVLSGFVIYNSFDHSNKNLALFYTIRAVRIHVPFLFSLVFSVGVLMGVVYFIPELMSFDNVREYNTRLIEAKNDLHAESILKTLVFVPSQEYAGYNFAYWSLLHEGIFYLAFPLYYFGGILLRLLLVCIMPIAWHFTGYDVCYYGIFFLFGMFMYDYYKKQRSLWLPKWAMYLLLAIGFLLTNYFVKINEHYAADGCALFMIIIAFNLLITGRVKSRKGLTVLADMSYTLYLNHLPILMLCYAFFYSILEKPVFFERYPYYCGVVISVISCYFIYLLVEKKSLNLIAKIKRAWN